MFSVLKIFVIYLVIPSYTSTLPIDDAKKVTVESPKAGDEEKEIFDELANHISDDKNKNLFKVILKFVAKNAEKNALIMVKNAEKNALIMVKNAEKNANALLEKEKERTDLYRVLLGIGRRVDTLEQILSSDSDIKLTGPRDIRWKLILRLETPIVQEFRARIIAAGITDDLFAKRIQLLCQERNERAGHVDVSLPEGLKSETLDEVLVKMKIPKDKHYKRIIQILLSPLTLPSLQTPSTMSPSNSPKTHSPSTLSLSNSPKTSSSTLLSSNSADTNLDQHL